jgi:hypothetical protein
MSGATERPAARMCGGYNGRPAPRRLERNPAGSRCVVLPFERCSAWGQIDDLGFVNDSEQPGAGLGPAHDGRGAGVLCGGDQTWRAAEGASQHGNEIEPQGLVQIAVVVKKNDVARRHVRERRAIHQMDDAREPRRLGGVGGPPHCLWARRVARFPKFATAFPHSLLSLPRWASRNELASERVAKPSASFPARLPPLAAPAVCQRARGLNDAEEPRPTVSCQVRVLLAPLAEATVPRSSAQAIGRACAEP